jgi:predicted small secreted protein
MTFAMKSLFLCAAALLIAAFSSCNTTVGLGRDMRILGEEMEKAAQKGQGGGADDYSGAPMY